MLFYIRENGNEKDWFIIENQFNPYNLGKFETIMCLGNGYMGIRSTTEEKYVGEKRNTFVAGTFNKFHDSEVSELPNCADMTAINLTINGEKLDLSRGRVTEYERKLNLKTGELTRHLIWEFNNTGKIRLIFRRFVSQDDLHLFASKVEITPIDKEIKMEIDSGINGQITNSGTQHFVEGKKRLFEEKCLQFIQTTTQSNIDFIYNSVHHIKDTNYKSKINIGRREIYLKFLINSNVGKTITFEKICSIHTSRDFDIEDIQHDLNEFSQKTYKNLILKSEKGYDTLFNESVTALNKKLWSKSEIKIGNGGIDQLKIRFAQYHMMISTPAHDSRMNIGAKGLTGEGYKGHTFWDTEIFMLPYYIWINPGIAHSLLKYRYLSLDGARIKAKENNYDGAMYPWESSWIDDGETTPKEGLADVITGEPLKIISGFIEQHITADVAYGVWFYYIVTNDIDFMKKYGYEIIFETAKFWISRIEWDDKKCLYTINDVIGPDEYKEHVNNNSYTNYIAHWNIKKSIEIYDDLIQNSPELFEEIAEKLDLINTYKLWTEKADKIYLPQPNNEGIIPQDDTYLSKKNINLSKYKNQKYVGEILKDYNLNMISNIQVSKQADVLLLLYLFGDLFKEDIKKKCWNYYEPKTLHDSSLSLAIHSILANELDYCDLSYSLFRKATEIDLGPNMKSSDEGIHMASLGGILQCIINGFAGIRIKNNCLSIRPKLPEKWNYLEFNFYWKGDMLNIHINHKKVNIKNVTDNKKETKIYINDKVYIIKEKYTHYI